ncbi:MAG: hypothetical protein ACRDTT_10675, partial [Pseudonocardiaceae bacterium]
MIAKRLLDHARLRGFAFRRVAPGQDGPLVGKRVGGDWVDVIVAAVSSAPPSSPTARCCALSRASGAARSTDGQPAILL